jgi:hypothetical protein
MLSPSRRSFLAGLFCAPAIIRPGLLMPVNPALAFMPGPRWYGLYDLANYAFVCVKNDELKQIEPSLARLHQYDMGEAVSEELNKLPPSVSGGPQMVTLSFIESLGVLGDRGVKWMGMGGPYPAWGGPYPVWAWPYNSKKNADAIHEAAKQRIGEHVSSLHPERMEPFRRPRWRG